MSNEWYLLEYEEKNICIKKCSISNHFWGLMGHMIIANYVGQDLVNILAIFKVDIMNQ